MYIRPNCDDFSNQQVGEIVWWVIMVAEGEAHVSAKTRPSTLETVAGCLCTLARKVRRRTDG